MGRKVSACLYIDKEILGTAKRVGLSLSKVAENARIGAIERLGHACKSLEYLANFAHHL